MPKKSQEFNKVAECLCRNGKRLHYAPVKVNGKQIRRSLKTNDLAIAKRRLVEFRAKRSGWRARRTETSGSRNLRTSGSHRSSPASSRSLTTLGASRSSA